MFTSTFMTTVWTTSANVYVELINKDNKWMISYSFRADTKHRITDSCTWKLIRKDEDNWVSYSAFTTIWWTTLYIFFSPSAEKQLIISGNIITLPLRMFTNYTSQVCVTFPSETKSMCQNLHGKNLFSIKCSPGFFFFFKHFLNDPKIRNNFMVYC